MTRTRKTKELILTAAIFICLEVAAIAILRASNSNQSIWLNRISTEAKAWLWGKTDHVNSYFHLKEKNLLLEKENAILCERLRKYRDVQDSIAVLSGVTADDEFEYIGAQIIKLSTNRQKNYFILNKGIQDGIEARMGVVTPTGVVGTIDAVTEKLAYGRTLMNQGSSVSARLGRNGLTGTLSWDGMSSNKAILHGIPLYFEVAVQDTVWTSGYSEMFPSGIALGTIRGSTVRNGTTKDVFVDLFQDFSSLNFVYILKNRYRGELEYLEEKGEEL